jgi:hypothetical protein
MSLKDEFTEVAICLEGLLSELDRLNLQNIAVHVDLALRRLEAVISSMDTSESLFDEGNFN